MNKTKLSLYIIFLLLTAILLFVFVSFSNDLLEKSSDNSTKQSIETLANELNSKNCRLYWIGEIPSLVSANVTTYSIDKASLSEQTLPFEMYSVQVDKDLGGGRTEHINSVVQGVDSTNTYIIINNVSDLTNEDYRLIIRCLNENDTMLYIFGDAAVKSFKDYMLLNNDSCYSLQMSSRTGTKSGFFDSNKDLNMNSTEWTINFFKQLSSETVMLAED